MSFDNRIFNINGEIREKDFFFRTIDLAFSQSGYMHAEGYVFDIKYGLILLAYGIENAQKFPTKLNPHATATIIFPWLSSDESKTVQCEGRDADIDHDGSNGNGWRIYYGEHGHFGNHYGAICAIRPVFVWYGK